jgi:hypothetical protein
VDGDFPCTTGIPGVERLVSVPAGGTHEETLIVGGARVTLQLTRDGAPLIGVAAALEAVSVEPTMPPWWPSSRDAASRMLPDPDQPRSLCTGSTDNSGAMTVSNVPFGPTRVVVFFSNANWSSGVVSIPVGGRTLRLDVPGQAVTARVMRADTGAAIPNSGISWEGSSISVRARATAAGDVLLDGVPPGPGRLTIAAEGFTSLVQKVATVPAVPLEFRLAWIAPPTVVVRVSDDTGAPIADALVYLDIQDEAADDAVAVTGPDGVARFNVRRPNTVQVTASVGDIARTSPSTPLRDDVENQIDVVLSRRQIRP